jgi:toxin CcdB
MTQFCIHRNANEANKKEVPYLLDIQSPLLSHLDTRVVIPLYRDLSLKKGELQGLTPAVEISGQPFLIMTSQVAGIPARYIGTQMLDISNRCDEIIAALDMLVSGI